MYQEVSSSSFKAAKVYGVKKNEILIIQVIDSSDLKCVKDQINIVKLQN